MLVLVHGIRTTTHLILYCHCPEHVLSVASDILQCSFRIMVYSSSIAWYGAVLIVTTYTEQGAAGDVWTCEESLCEQRRKERKCVATSLQWHVSICTIKMIVKSVIIPWCMWATLSRNFGVNRGVSPRYVELWITFSFHPNTNFTLALTIITVVSNILKVCVTRILWLCFLTLGICFPSTMWLQTTKLTLKLSCKRMVSVWRKD